MRFRSVACISVLAIMPWLVGCASIAANSPAEEQVIPSAQRQAEIGRITNWQASGRIALSSEREAISGSLDWQQRGSDYAVSLTALFGQKAMHVVQTGTSATLATNGQATATGHSAELLVLNQLGVRVPLVQLAYWLRGLPGTVGTAQYDRFGRLHTLKYQDPDGRNWRARVKSYNQVNTLDLPRTIEVTDGVNKIRLVVSSWQLGSVPPKEPAVTPGDPEKPPKRIPIPGSTT